LIDQFEKHHLLMGDESTPKNIRFSRVTKEHIMLFLKETENAKHYENVNMIYYTLTGNKADDISHLEHDLLEDFDKLVNLYDKIFKNINRKKFINMHMVLYELLMRHKHPCKKEDFPVLKTIDRKEFYDEVTKVLFESLGWNYVPFY